MARPNNTTKILIYLGIGGLLFVSIVGVALTLWVRSIIKQAQAMADPPFVHAGPGAQTHEELLTKYGDCLRNNGAGGAAYWDVPRYTVEIDSRGVLVRHDATANAHERHTWMIAWVKQAVANNVRDDVYDDTVIRKTTWIVPDREAMLETTHTRKLEDGRIRAFRFRWWVVHDGGWRIFDFQSVDAGRRESAANEYDLSRRLDVGWTDTPARLQAEADFEAAYDAFAANDYLKAERLYAALRLDNLKPDFREAVTRHRASIALRQFRRADAKALLLQAEREDPQNPDVYDMLAELFDYQQQWVELRAAADHYLKVNLGKSRIYLWRGKAQLELGNKAEAAADFRLALDDEPNSTVALASLARCLGPAGHAELEQRFRAFEDPAKYLRVVVDNAEKDHALAARYVRVVREQAPNDPEGDYQEARIKLFVNDVAQAVRMLLALLKRDKEHHHYLDRMAWDAEQLKLGMALYDALPDEHLEEGFRSLAETAFDELDEIENRGGKSLTRLEEFVAAHKKKKPNDVWLAFYEGTLHHERKEYDKAEHRLADAMARAPDDETRNRFRWLRIENLADAGRAFEAYPSIGPIKETFTHLATKFHDPKDLPSLEKLVWMHGKLAPADPPLSRWRGEIAFRRGRYEVAVAELRQFLKHPEKGYDYVAREKLVRSLLRLKRFAEARTELKLDDKAYYNRVLDAAITAASGDVAATERELAVLVKDHFGDAEWFHTDEDLSAALHTPPFKSLLEKYPKPEERKKDGK